MAPGQYGVHDRGVRGRWRGRAGDGERVYHDNDACEEGNKIPKVQRAIGTGKDRKHCPTCAGLG
jgi:hypothetical protein